MENKREDGVLTIFIPERIDAGNASDQGDKQGPSET